MGKESKYNKTWLITLADCLFTYSLPLLHNTFALQQNTGSKLFSHSFTIYNSQKMLIDLLYYTNL